MIHAIKKGENLTVIARKYNTTVEHLLELNATNTAAVKSRDVIIKGEKLIVPDVFTPATQPRPNQFGTNTGANPANDFAHVQFLRSQLTTVPSELKNDPAGLAAYREQLTKEIGYVTAAANGQLALPEQTQNAVNEMTRGMSAEERAIVTAKAFELTRSSTPDSPSLSLDQTNPSRFSANMALELAEYVGSGAAVSALMTGQVEKLHTAGIAEFRQKPKLEAEFLEYKKIGAEQRVLRAGGVLPVQNGGPSTLNMEHTEFLETLMPTAKPADQAEYRAEIDLINQAKRGELRLPPDEKKLLDEVTKDLTLTPEHRAIMTAKAHELVSEGYTIKSQGEAKFATTMVLELGDYAAMGAPPGTMMDAMQRLHTKAQPHLRENPEIENHIGGRLMLGGTNMTRREKGLPIFTMEEAAAAGVFAAAATNPTAPTGPINQRAVIDGMQPYNKQIYAHLLRTDAPQARDFLEAVAKDPNFNKAAEGVTRESLIAELSPAQRRLHDQLARSNPTEANQFLMEFFVATMDIRTGPQLTQAQTDNLIGQMQPFLRQNFDEMVQTDRMGAFRLLQALSVDPRPLQGGPGNEAAVIGRMNPQARQQYEQLQATNPVGARNMLMQFFWYLATTPEKPIEPAPRAAPQVEPRRPQMQQ